METNIEPTWKEDAAPEKTSENTFLNGPNAAAQLIIENVVTRLIRCQGSDYKAARAILDATELPEEDRKIVEEEVPIVAALYACLYEGNGRLRLDDRGKPISKEFIESKVLNMKAQPYRAPLALLLRGLFMDFWIRIGKKESRKCWRRLFHELRRPVLDELQAAA
jgi:hypothetical protein